MVPLKSVTRLRLAHPSVPSEALASSRAQGRISRTRGQNVELLVTHQDKTSSGPLLSFPLALSLLAIHEDEWHRKSTDLLERSNSNV
eukprot:IDg21531t1